MSFRELQTAATRVLYADRPTESVVNELTSRFRFHPLDAEGLFSVPVESTFSSYGSYGMMTLLWPSATHGEVTEIRIVVEDNMLVVIGDTSDHQSQLWFNAVEKSVDQPQWQQTPVELIHGLLSSLRAQWSEVTISDTPGLAQRATSVALALRQFCRFVKTQKLQAGLAALILEAHHIDLLADRLRGAKETPELFPLELSSPKLPRLLGTYAVSAAVMVVIVIVTLSTR